jgi:hypothetical protein
VKNGISALVLKGGMKELLEIRWPWGMVWIEESVEIISQIKKALPPDHELQPHALFPRIKWEKRPIFVVDNDTTGQTILMNFEKMKRWKKTRFKVPAITVFKDHAEVSEMVDRDHLTECAKHNPDGIFK